MQYVANQSNKKNPAVHFRDDHTIHCMRHAYHDIPSKLTERHFSIVLYIVKATEVVKIDCSLSEVHVLKIGIKRQFGLQKVRFSFFENELLSNRLNTVSVSDVHYNLSDDKLQTQICIHILYVIEM